MKERKKHFFAIVITAILLILSGICLIYFYSKKTECVFDFECGWRPTNCCTENAGAEWGCENLKTYKANCPDIVICPQVLSPKPQSACVCVNGGCQKK